jgi:hypothetical protein
MKKYFKLIAVSVILSVILGFSDFYLLIITGKGNSEIKSIVVNKQENVIKKLRYGYSDLLQSITLQNSLELLKMDYKADKKLVNTELSCICNMDEFAEILNRLILKGNVDNINAINLTEVNLNGNYEKTKINIKIDFIKNK